MIIQCKACKSKYRFDENLIEGDGIWARCSRCENVFFQMALPEMDAPRDGTGKSKFALEPLITEPAAPDWPLTNRPVPDSRTAVSPAVEPPSVEASAAEPFDMMSPLGSDITVDVMDEVVLPEQEPPKKKSSVIKWVLGAILIIVVALGAVYYVFPSVGVEAIKQIATFFPAASVLLPPDADVKNIGPAQIKITDLKQRFVEHVMMGNIRVIEGMAVNTASEPMTRIKVRAQLFDVIGTPVGDSASYCGNLLTDQELKTAPEEQIVRKLSIPQGSDISNDRVPPNGMVPFMIVFFREPPGVAKALVMPLEAERLLP
ncbi:MAG: hypothetical protein CSYNP_00655 [Syntrophus sp. SKADARSKE-3]|nr:hypothetical protein [Syntrophus sp. SKADARSKE-3]